MPSRKGSPNKTTDYIKQAIIEAFSIRNFKKWVEENPNIFYSQVIPRLLPREVTIDPLANKIEIIIRDCTKDELVNNPPKEIEGTVVEAIPYVEKGAGGAA